jgi:hypothetical protein
MLQGTMTNIFISHDDINNVDHSKTAIVLIVKESSAFLSTRKEKEF